MPRNSLHEAKSANGDTVGRRAFTLPRRYRAQGADGPVAGPGGLARRSKSSTMWELQEVSAPTSPGRHPSAVRPFGGSHRDRGGCRATALYSALCDSHTPSKRTGPVKAPTP
jgi:hypothetical protein